MVDQNNIIVSTYGEGANAWARLNGTLPLGLASVLEDVANERARQDAKWGEQNHPDGTGPGLYWMMQDDPAADVAGYFRDLTNHAAKAGLLHWWHIAVEEVAEAFAEDDPVKLRAELVQCAAVFAAWTEAIDRRAAR